MARIFLSMSGEGRGHAARTSALVERLRMRHQLCVFAPDAAYDLMAPLGRKYGFEVHRIPGITNRYTPDRRFDLWATGVATNAYLRNLPNLVSFLEQRVRSEKPDLAITDFEPALPRAAQRCGLPYVSIDHQHFMVVNDLSTLPPRLQWHAFWGGLVVRRFYNQQRATVVSSFYLPPLKPQYREGVVRVGVLLRNLVTTARIERSPHLVAYFRRFAPDHVLEALSRLGRPVHVYGLSRSGRRKNLVFKRVDGEAFIEDLATSSALIATAGNQLVGESLFLGKPVLAMPESHNFEQEINAHFLRESGRGEAIEIESCCVEHVRRFLARVDAGHFDGVARQQDGTQRCVEVVERVLKHGRWDAGVSRRSDGLEAA